MSSESIQPDGPALTRRPARRRPIPLVGPIILIGLGLLFLAQNLGLLAPGFWQTIWQSWPLLLILAGIEVLIGRSSWAVTIVAAVVVALIGGVIAFSSVTSQVGRWSFGGWPAGSAAPASVELVSEELGQAQRAVVDLRHGAGQLTIGALSDDTSRLIDASLAQGDGAWVERDIRRRGDTVTVDLNGRTDRPAMFGDAARQDWTVNLSPRVPLELEVHSGASQAQLDLRELKVTRLDVQAGASALDVTLPRAAGFTEARIESGVAGVNLTIPEEVAARITSRGGLSGTTIDEARFPRVGDHFQSPEYERAANRVDLDIRSGVSGVTVR